MNAKTLARRFTSRSTLSSWALAAVVAASPTLAAPRVPQVFPLTVAAEPQAPQAPAEELSDEERIEQLEDKVSDLDEKLRVQQETSIKPVSNIRVFGYSDVGFFVPTGDGSGTRQDFGHTVFPEFANRFAWVFLGDLLAPMVNSRGEVADLGDLPNANRYDPINSNGAPGFIVNEFKLGVTGALAERVLYTTSVNFTPRNGANFSLGDVLDLDIAQIEWMPFANGKTSVFVGKFDSVIGIEYRERRSDQRFGIVPTLIQRYTSGTPIGLKARTKLFNDRLVGALSLTNGSSSVERFHFYNEIDTNAAKTVSGRLSVRPPLFGFGNLEIGLSGLYGAQDNALSSNKYSSLWGLDMIYELHRFTLKGQFLKGAQPGLPSDNVYSLKLHGGGYLEGNYMILPWLGVLLRAEARNAVVTLGDERAYITKSWRWVTGARVVFNQHLVFKAEYVHNGEYGRIPKIANDVFTTSFLAMF